MNTFQKLSRKNQRLSAFIGGLVVLFFSAEASAQMYKCVQDGKTVYQQEKCPDKAKETTLRGSDPPAATQSQVAAGEAKAEKTNTQGFELVADVTTGFNLCSDYDPEFRAKYTVAYNEWAGRNSAAVKAFTADAGSTKTVQERMAISRARTAGDDLEAKAKRAAVCAKVLAIIQ
ncbi:MAG: DUF4124 domain-containing protein [Usitatibacter sp.]